MHYTSLITLILLVCVFHACARPILCSLGPDGVGEFSGMQPRPTSSAWPTSNMAFFTPLHLDTGATILKLAWINGGTVSGNSDIGIYNSGGTLLVSAGSTSNSGTNSLQVVSVASTALAAGDYYLALAMDNTVSTALFGGTAASIMNGYGLLQQGSAFPLPASASPTTLTLAYAPLLCASQISNYA